MAACIAALGIFSAPHINIISAPYPHSYCLANTIKVRVKLQTHQHFKPAKTIMAPTQKSTPQQVTSAKKVRFAQDLTPQKHSMHKSNKRAAVTHPSIHQTIDGRVCKIDVGIKASTKDKRVRQSKVQHAVGKKLAEYDFRDSDNDTTVNASDKDTSDEESHGSPSPSESEVGFDSESEDSDESQDESEDEEEGAADADTDSSPDRNFLITVRHTDGTNHDFFVWGNTLLGSSRFFRAARSWAGTQADDATQLEEDVNHFESYLTATFGCDEFKEEITQAIAASRLHPTDGDEATPEKRRKREKTFEKLIAVYILADKYEDLAGANRVIDTLIRFSHETNLLPHLGAINQAYDSSPEGSQLRKLLRDIFVHESSPAALSALIRDGVDLDFIADVALEFCQLRNHHPNGHINKWFNQAAADRPQGHYHQELFVPTPEERGVRLTGNFVEIPRIVKSIETADEDSQGERSNTSGHEEISKASSALLQAMGG